MAFQRRLLVLAPPSPWIPSEDEVGGSCSCQIARFDALEQVEASDWDVVIFRPEDHREQRPAEVFDSLRQIAPEATFLAICEDADIREAVSYLKNGVFEYLTLPLLAGELSEAILGAMDNRDAYREIMDLNTMLLHEKAALEKRNLELASISSVARAVSRSLELGEVLDRLLDCIGETFQFDRVAVGLVYKEKLAERPLAGRGEGMEDVLGHGWELDDEEEEGWIDTVFGDQEPLLVAEASTDALTADTKLARMWPGPLCKVPLRAYGDVVGTLTVGNHLGGKVISKEDLELLKVFADTAAMAVENSRLYGMVREMSLRDELTGLYNRRHFMDRAREELSNSQRHDLPVSVLMLDLDYFKILNDKNNHLVGDAALKKVARILERSTRGNDTVARFGGEEMVVLLPSTGVEGARRAAEKLRTAIESTVFKGEEHLPGGTLTVSIGLARYPGDAASAEGLIERADKALYKAKEAGRNRIEVFAG